MAQLFDLLTDVQIAAIMGRKEAKLAAMSEARLDRLACQQAAKAATKRNAQARLRRRVASGKVIAGILVR